MSEKHVLDNVKVVAKGKVLVDGGDPQILGILRPPEVDGLTVPQDLSLIGFPQPRDGLDQAGLSCPVVADQSGHPARWYVEVHLGERLHGAEGLRHASQLHQRVAYAVEFGLPLPQRGRGRLRLGVRLELYAIARRPGARRFSYGVIPAVWQSAAKDPAHS